MLDIFYLTYKSDFSERNLNRILSLAAPDQRVINIDGVNGIYNAHRECALQSEYEHFFVVDGDAFLRSDFDLGYIPSYETEVYSGVVQANCTHVWRAYNPVIDMTYGYGGVKLLHYELFEDDLPTQVIDMTTTIARKNKPYYSVKSVSNDTIFNTSEFSAWKGAFRECAKLSSGIMTDEIDEKIQRWLQPNPTADFAYSARLGAKMGVTFGRANNGNVQKMLQINDFNWLENCFKEVAHNV
jgi:hypothetical protein